ncbi:UDP-N-acetylmuramate dehydrogenase [Anaerobranca gottschalkii]|uniref:UDP-N-acetylenolpyruvoylglucosamine reductase n=1 Tax=Anaerobranca gottschalkii DSM 13577 TaxID=1120990 RepID=A0A1H9YVC8_9FIRM|nr:UDP-N-acetylmuramate dehydrogenase [Anaerobranca gottschalkii]SES73131.1 UDP-N-acetylmuramate dehydrogenase [Anaerobranca gottschalkii DSM 13577]
MLEELLKITVNVKTAEPLSKHTTIKIGGNGDFLVIAQNLQEIVKLVTLAKERNQPLLIIGNGSNLLVSDEGVRGIVLKILNSKSKISVDNQSITVFSGIPLSKLIFWAISNGYSGIEELIGIPGTLGGSVVMNAGAMGREIGELVQWVKVLDIDNLEIYNLKKDDLNFSYRKSSLQRKNLVVLEVNLSLWQENPKYLQQRVKEILKVRKANQPINYPNAGSIFKNPPNFSAGKLIEEVGLKGYRIGDAQISTKHGNFIVNLGKAKAVEVMALINLARKEVFTNFGIKLEPEVKIIGGGLNLEEV